MTYFSFLNYELRLVPIKLPLNFTVIKPKDVRFTRKTATVKDDTDMTSIN